MAIVTSDIIDGSTYTKDANGITVTRRFLVDGVPPDQKRGMYLAVTQPSIPNRGDYHPAFPALRADTISATPANSNTQFWVNVTYKSMNYQNLPPDATQPAQVSVGGVVQSVQTSYDVNGNLMALSFDYASKDANGNPTVTTLPQTGTVSIQVPCFSIKYSRKETGSPLNVAAVFSGRINSVSFAGQDAGQWLCTHIEGVSKDGGLTYDVSYDFQLAPSALGWVATVTYIDPATGAPLPPYDKNNPVPIPGSVKQFQIYKTADFNLLRLF